MSYVQADEGMVEADDFLKDLTTKRISNSLNEPN
jgi:hypothetical protein